MTSGRDPYKFFRVEARELLEGLSQGVLELEKGTPDKDRVNRLLRFAHTLKGASRVVKLPDIADRAHTIEGILAPHRAGLSSLRHEHVDELLALLDAIGARVSSLETAKEGVPERNAAAGAEEPFETVRVELEEMDLLLRRVTESSVRLAALRRESAALERVRQLAEAIGDELAARRANGSHSRAPLLANELRELSQRLGRSLASGIEQLDSELTQVREAADRVRLLPASNVFAQLERAARDAALAMQKTIDFRTSGGTTRLDAHVLAALRDGLLHVVRNAVAHGVEPESERVSRGKPPAGRIDVLVERRGDRVAFLCRDDGRGIDVDALGAAAVREGMLSPAVSARLTRQEAFRLLLRGGLTTTPTVTDVSGRGIGLDVVREVVARLKGEVHVESEPGRGTTFEIVVPMSLSSLPTLTVDVGDMSASVPLDAVQNTRRLPDSEIARSSSGESVVYSGKVIPFLSLHGLLCGRGSAAARRETWSALILKAGGAHAAIGVDRLRGIENTVVMALPSHAEVDAVVAGAALDADGRPRLVLDPIGLVAAAREPRAASAKQSAPKDPVLVIDDSLTTRILEQSILEAAGYEVELAVSGEEALGKAKARSYSLFLVDVEMPGMDGFQFVERARADPQLRDVPSILVTSRASPDDRRRGQQVGARAHIAKGEFDQAVLLRTIRDLIG